ncbi:MAG: hypothetical protein GY953_07605, partial [bacterium]|nr:hypothetical protein [bacterium]
MIKLGKGLRDVSDETLQFFLQMGVKYTTLPSRYSTRVTKRPLVPGTDRGPQPGQILKPWDIEELARTKKRIEDVGLTPMMLHLGRFTRILHGRDGDGAELD